MSLGPDIPVNTGFFQILPVILVTQQYDLYLGLPGWIIYLLVVVLHDYIPSSPSSIMPHSVVVAVAVVALRGVLRSPSLCHVGVTITVIALHVVLWLLLLRCIWRRGCCRYAVYGAMVTVIAPCLASRSLSLCSRWYCGHCCCATYGVVVAVVAQRVVLQSLLLHCV